MSLGSNLRSCKNIVTEQNKFEIYKSQGLGSEKKDKTQEFDIYLDALRKAILSRGRPEKVCESPLECNIKKLIEDPVRTMRKVQSTPMSILDAPDVVDDYYIQHIDWAKSGLLFVALCEKLYAKNTESTASPFQVQTPDELDDTSDPITALCVHNTQPQRVSIGTRNGILVTMNVNESQQTMKIKHVQERVSCLKASATNLLCYGNTSGEILIRDDRVQDSWTPEITIQAHQRMVCSIEWRDDTIFASGGNDDLLNIWDIRNTQQPIYSHTREAAIKPLAWCPTDRNILAAGGGTADMHIYFYNTSTMNYVGKVYTNSQVGGIKWSPCGREFVSCHGYSNNEITVWQYKGMRRIATIQKAHDARVLSMAQNSDMTKIATISGDETLKLWKIFERRKPLLLKRTHSEMFGNDIYSTLI